MNDLDDYCESLYRRIHAAYERSGNNDGWGIFASPKKTLNEARIAFLGLNPGGKGFPESSRHHHFARESGSAFVDDDWGCEPGEHPLQKQIRKLFKKIEVKPEDVLAGNFVPFRSPRWKYLKEKKFALQVGEEIWGDILRRVKPDLVIGMATPIFPSLCRILNVKETQSIPIGWGRYKGERAHFDNFNSCKKRGLLVRIPHLSTFKIMNRKQSEDGLRTLFQEYWRG
ncbi:MAG: hypothetical protein OXF09_01250 [Hyphomicrobiales bacterium]|nr:hypothetical protein [Hyphomicrobiales bacterium]